MNKSVQHCSIELVCCVVATLGFCFAGCSSTSQIKLSCVQVPPTLSTGDQKNGAEIAAKLEQLPVDASLKANFDRTARAEWGKVSDANAELFIFLQAIDCYSKGKTPIGAEMARELMAVVRQKYAQTKGITTFGTAATGGSSNRKLTKSEKADLSATAAGRESLAIYQKFGVH